MTEQPKLRFAVGTFESWSQVREALHDLRARGLVLDSFNCLGLKRLFSGKTVMAPDQEPMPVQALPFPGSSRIDRLHIGTPGQLPDREACIGRPSLKHAVGLWLIPRHAAHFEDAVQAGKLLLWIRVADADDERRAYQSLLAHSSNSVGVHDLVLPGEQ